MRKWLAVILFMLLLVPVTGAQAQTPVTLANLEVKLWSEYDQPSMLVIYDFKLTPEAALPASVNIRIPRDANIVAAAYLDGAQYLNAEFAGPADDGNWQVVTFFIKAPTSYRLEYYQPLQRSGNIRSFAYQWNGDYAVKNFRLEIQVPEDSTAVKSSPMYPFAPSQPFLNGSATLNNLPAGQTYDVSIEYTRVSDETSVPPNSPQVTASEQVTPDTTGRITLDSLPYILGGVGVLLVAGAFYYFWQSRSAETNVRPRKRTRPAEGTTGTQTYCHECGTRANPEDRFCRVCGTKFRTG